MEPPGFSDLFLKVIGVDKTEDSFGCTTWRFGPVELYIGDDIISLSFFERVELTWHGEDDV